MLTECTHTLDSGHKCQAPARDGSTFCHHHNPRQLLDPHPREMRELRAVDSPLLDKCAILVAVSEVLYAASERRIKCSEARTLLSGLKFASRLMTEIETTGLSSSTSFDSHSYPQQTEQESSPAPAQSPDKQKARPTAASASKPTPRELDDFTQLLHSSAVQQLRHQIAASATRRVAEIADDRPIAALAASRDPLSPCPAIQGGSSGL